MPNKSCGVVQAGHSVFTAGSLSWFLDLDKGQQRAHSSQEGRQKASFILQRPYQNGQMLPALLMGFPLLAVGTDGFE